MALMNASAQVFPDAKKLLYRWHIYRSILSKCMPSITNNKSWNAFYKMWNILLESETENAYVCKLADLEVVLQNFPVITVRFGDIAVVY